MNLFNELKQRNVFKVGGAYVIISWLIMQAGEVMSPALRLPEWVNSMLAFFLILGFPLAMFLAWAFEMTPEGLKMEKDVDRGQPRAVTSGRRMNYTIIALLAVVLVYSVWEFRFRTGPEPVSQGPVSQGPAAQTVNPGTEQKVSTPVTQDEGPDSNTIAVLPFINMSSDPEQEYFSDGITEEVLNLLVKIPELKVTSRTSVFSFKGEKIDIPTVAEKLGVAHILEGSVRKAGNRVRITTQLIEAGNDVHLWSETYERQLDDIFAIQDEIAREVVKALKIQLLGEAPSAVSTNIEAYNLYLRGKYFAALYTKESYESAITAYRESIALDANFAPPWEGLSTVLSYQGYAGITDMQEAMEASRQAAMRALELDDKLAEAWLALARIQLYYDWDWSRAEVTMRTALKYGSQNAPVLRQATWVALTLGEAERALELAQLAVDLDPLDFAGLRNLGTTYWALGQPEEEERIYRQILELYPESVSVKSWLAAALTVQGNPEEGLQYLDFDSENRWQQAMSIVVLHNLGRHEEERPIRQKIIDKRGQTWAFGIALTYAWHGDTDKAFEWLDIAFKQKDSFMSQLIYNPWLAPLHDDPRWEKILDKMGLLKYWEKSQARREEAES
jgi:TolB-like protein/Flp pilus assembly protein TadD